MQDQLVVSCSRRGHLAKGNAVTLVDETTQAFVSFSSIATVRQISAKISPFFSLLPVQMLVFYSCLVVEWSGNETCTFWDCYNMFAFIVQQPRGGHQ